MFGKSAHPIRLVCSHFNLNVRGCLQSSTGTKIFLIFPGCSPNWSRVLATSLSTNLHSCTEAQRIGTPFAAQYGAPRIWLRARQISPRRAARFAMAALFVGGLSGRSTPLDVEALFSRYGRCRADVRNGWAFIFYQAQHHAEEAMRELNHRVRACYRSTSS